MKSKYLLVAAIEGNLKKIKELVLDWNADVNIRNEYGDTPLHWAAGKGHIDMVKFLLESGADKSIRNRVNETPRCWAVWAGNTQILKILQDN